MKYLEVFSWVFGILAGIVMLLGVLDFFFEAELVPVNHVINYFHVATTFLLAAVCCTVYLIWSSRKQS